MGIEIEVETDRAAVLGLEVRQLPQAVPAHSLCHLPLFSTGPGTILAQKVRIFTVGHGRRDADELVAVLREAGAATLVDVRRFPSSRRNPQFNQRRLAETLEQAGIGTSTRSSSAAGGAASQARSGSPASASPPSARTPRAWRGRSGRRRSRRRWPSLRRRSCARRRPGSGAIAGSSPICLTARGFELVHLIRPGERGTTGSLTTPRFAPASCSSAV